MEKNKFVTDLLGKLDRKKTQKQINADIKQIEKTINMLRIIGMFAKGDTKENLNAYIKSLQSQLNHVKLTFKIDSKNLKNEVDKALNNVSFKDIDALNIDENKIKIKVEKIIADTKAYVEKNPISVGINYEDRRGKLDNEPTTYLNKHSKSEGDDELLKEAEKVKEMNDAINEKKSHKGEVGRNSVFDKLKKGANFLAGGLKDRLVDAVITEAITAYDNWIHRVEKANQAMDEAVSEYDLAKSSIESINLELTEHNNKINELLSKDKLSYTEKGQLKDLQAITKELMIQQDIERRRADKASKEATEKTIDAYEVRYGKYDKTREELKQKLSNEHLIMPESEDDILGNITAYVRTKELLEKSQREYQDVMQAGGDTRWVKDDISHNTEVLEDISQVLGGNISDLQEKRLALEEEYNKAVENRQTGIGVLTPYEQDVISTYESIYDMIKMVYEYTSQNEWNSMEVTDILNTKGIEKTKEELIAMSNAGELTPETLAGFANLNRAIQNSELVFQDGQTLAEAFCNGIQACAEAEKDMVQNLSETDSIIPTISSSVQQLSAQLAPQFGKLGEAYQAIFTDDGSLDAVDNAMLEELRKTFADIEEENGVAFSPSLLNPFFDTLTNKSSTLEDVQKAFDNLATAYFYNTDTLEYLNEETADAIEKQLEEMGVQNASEVVTKALAVKTEELAVAKKYLAQEGKELSAASLDDANAFILEQIEAGNCSEALALLQLKKMLVNGTLLDANTDINNVLSLAKAAGVAVDSLGILANLKAEFDSAKASGHYLTAAVLSGKIAIYKAQIESEIANFNPVGVKFGNFGGGASEAKSAGKDAGKSYKDGLKEELSDLDGVISGITGRIDDQISVIKTQKEAALESIDAQIEALEEQKSLLEEQKKALEEARDVAVDALEDERDARIEVIEQQKKQLDEQIKLIEKQIKDKEKVIDRIQDEIKSMKDANEQRKRQIDLQKAQYELERLQNQRTIFQYSKEKGMHYVADDSKLSDAKDKVDNAKLEIEIANKEKQIDLIEKEIGLLNEKKDAISEQISLLDDQIERINEFYDDEIEKTKELYDGQIKAIDIQIEAIDRQIESIQKQREQTELYYESMIENLEKSKTRYQELTEILGQAELSAKLKQLGIDEEALLNGSEEEFEKMKNAYMGVVFKLNEGNAEVLSKLQALSGYEGTAPVVLTDSNAKLDEMNGKLDQSNRSVENINSSLGETATSTGTVAANVGTVSDSLNQMPDSQSVKDLSGAFDALADSIGKVADALGISGDLPISSITQALSDLKATTLGSESEGIIGQFALLESAIVDVTNAIGLSGTESVNSLTQAVSGLNGISLDKSVISKFDNFKTAVMNVVSAISGGASDDGASDSSGSGKGSGEGGLKGAIKDIKSATDKALGGGGRQGEGLKGGKGAIDKFKLLKTAVASVASSIGSEADENAEGEKGDTLIGSIDSLKTSINDTLGESGGNGIIGKFEQFKQPIQEAQSHVEGIYEGLQDINNEKVECTIKVNIEKNGEIPLYAEGLLGNMNLESGEYNAKYGRANAEGTGKYKGLSKDEKNALVSEYGQTEMTVLPDGNTIITDEPTMMDLPKDTVIFNEEQTKKILDNKIDASGNARSYSPAPVNVNTGRTDVRRNNIKELTAIEYIRELQGRHQANDKNVKPGEINVETGGPENRYSDKFIEDALKQIVNPVHIVTEHMEKMASGAEQIRNMNNVGNIFNNKNVQQPVTVQIGDINLTGVQDVDGLAYAIKTQLPGKMSQEYFKN